MTSSWRSQLSTGFQLVDVLVLHLSNRAETILAPVYWNVVEVLTNLRCKTDALKPCESPSRGSVRDRARFRSSARYRTPTAVVDLIEQSPRLEVKDREHGMGIGRFGFVVVAASIGIGMLSVRGANAQTSPARFVTVDQGADELKADEALAHRLGKQLIGESGAAVL